MYLTVDLIHGKIQAPQDVNISAIPLSVLQTMAQTNTWPPDFPKFLCCFIWIFFCTYNNFSYYDITMCHGNNVRFGLGFR